MKMPTTPSGLLSFWVLLIGLAIIILGISFAHAAEPEGSNLAIDRQEPEFNLRWIGTTNSLFDSPQVDRQPRCS